MNKEKLEKYLLSMKGAESSYPFGSEALVFKVMGKMYALVSQHDEIPRVTLKVNPADGEVLTSQYACIKPGYYMNKKHWVTISLTGELPSGVLKDLADASYDLVVVKLTKKEKETLKGAV